MSQTQSPDSSNSSSPWYQQMSQVVEQLGADGFFAALFEALSSQLPLDHPQVWLFRANKLPALLYHAIARGDREIQIDGYIAGAYRQDPFYREGRRGADGLFRITEIGANQFKQSERYAGYFSQMNVCDEVGYLYELGEGTFINLTLQRRQHSERFSDEELNFLHRAEPLIRALTEKHWNLYRDQLSNQNELEDSIERAIRLFGSSVLTEREHQTLQLMLRGYSSQSAAERLEISIETLRRHRKHIYQKLDIGSQAELFSLFINCLPYLPPEEDGDPLVPYQSPQSSDP
ncbi:response regulator transcription factor [Motiliproteus coralliicola]|nr:helix-turn-helix transcriptional regulator [Motiliproteus coralliicola]